MKLGVVIIAAGEGTRMRSSLPKELHPLCGLPMIGHVLGAAQALDSARTVLVLSERKLEPVQAMFGRGYEYVIQSQRLGTGHAVLQAREAMRGASDDVLVLYGDVPLLRPETARAAVEARRASGALVCVLSFVADPPTGYGRIVRDGDGHVTALVEERNATPAQRAITECNSGITCADASWLWNALDRIQPNPVNGEYYLTDLVELAVTAGGPGAAVATAMNDPRDGWGINDRVQLAEAEAVLRARILGELMRSGVTVTDPAATYVDIGVTVGRDATLLPGTILRGATHVGVGCVIGPHTTLSDATIGDGAKVQYSIVENMAIPAGAVIGPFAHVTMDEPVER
jgi:bifunctional UDP-N-acetylglucosamine pyrophosphorylase/glucosamine-1-phosphate N-acetyltransferase